MEVTPTKDLSPLYDLDGLTASVYYCYSCGCYGAIDLKTYKRKHPEPESRMCKNHFSCKVKFLSECPNRSREHPLLNGMLGFLT